MTTNTDYSKEVRAMVSDLWDLEFQAEANKSNPNWKQHNDFVYAYDIAFPLAKLVSLNYVDFDTLSGKALDEISDTWSIAVENGLFSTAWDQI